MTWASLDFACLKTITTPASSEGSPFEDSQNLLSKLS